MVLEYSSSVPMLFVAVKVNREEGFHIDLEDYLMGLLQLASELVSKDNRLMM